MYNLPTNGKTIEDKITGGFSFRVAADYELTLGTVIIQTKKPEHKALFQSQEPIIIALTKGAGTCKFIADDSEVPQGCGTEVVTADINVHIPVQVCALTRTSCDPLLIRRQGKVDAQSEINKLEKKTALAQSNKDKLAKQMSIPNYETTIKEDVRAGNIEKVRDEPGFASLSQSADRILLDGQNRG
jgi:valyl-tRNA synthetase